MYLNYHSKSLNIGGTAYTVSGRITYTCNKGCYWDAYLLKSRIGDSSGDSWLEYDDGVLKLFKPYPLVGKVEIQELNSLEVGETKYIFGRNTFISNKLEAKVSDFSGTFPFSLSKGDSVKIIEGMADGLLVSFELEGSEVELSFGEIIPFSSIKR